MTCVTYIFNRLVVLVIVRCSWKYCHSLSSQESVSGWRRGEIQWQINWLSWLASVGVSDHHNHFTALFPGPPGWAGARRELLDFMVQGKINRGRHTDHPAGRHSIRTKQCPPPPSPILYMLDALPATQPAASKHWRQLRIWIREKTLEFSLTMLRAPSPYP